MKSLKTLAFAALLFISCSNDKSKPVEVIQNYGTGEVSRQYFTINGQKDGKMTDYFPDGKVKAERLFQNDKQTGRTIIYYPSGKIRETQHYADGLKHGGDTLWHESGIPQTAIRFEHGKKNGFVHTWDLDGKLIFEAKYEMDSLVEVKGEDVRPEKSLAKAEKVEEKATPVSKPVEGPTGYTSRKNTVLQNAPTQNAATIEDLKIYDEVIIVEIKMTDETGKEHDVPQWYKVRTKSGKQGWVTAKNVSVN